MLCNVIYFFAAWLYDIFKREHDAETSLHGNPLEVSKLSKLEN